MKGKRLGSSRSQVGKEVGEEDVGKKLRGELMLGDFLWVRLHGSSWWPAQVVDANTVSERIKPSNRSVGEVLVRLYGSYNYWYVDPMQCRSEFENILKQTKGSYAEIFQKALEQDLRHSKSGRSKGQGSRSKVRVEASNDEMLKKNQIEENQEIQVSKSRSGVLGKHPSISVRETRTQKANLVAQSLKGNASANEGRNQHSDIVKKNNLVVNNATSYHQVRVSPRRLLAANGPPTTMTNGNLLSEKIEEEKGKASKQGRLHKKLNQNSPSVEGKAKCRTSKPDGVQKKLIPNSQSNEDEAINISSGQDGVQEKLKLNSPSIEEDARGKTSKQDEDWKKLGLNNSSVKGEGKSKNSKQDGVQKKRKPISPSAEVEAKRKTSKKDGAQKKLKLNSPRAEEEAKGKTSMQAGVQKKRKPNSPSAEQEAKGIRSMQDGGRKKHKPNSPSVAEVSKGKTSKRDGVQKKLKSNGSSVEEQPKIKTFKQEGVQNKPKRNRLGIEEEAKCKTPKQNGVQKKLKPNSPSAEEAKSSGTLKEDGKQKKLKPSSPNSETTSLGKSPQELSARRMKVMQSLGLIAPSGSPFNRDIHV
ncbi:hypothetical protein L1049_025671 [Liquidambar formosana]|uniref:PWWP domain-containing protein n=1 Tax=Liquidambar formosana TaxID=63359 RepID=A0AAP0NDC6_LIQFO